MTDFAGLSKPYLASALKGPSGATRRERDPAVAKEHNHEVHAARQVVASATTERATRLKPFRQVNPQRSSEPTPAAPVGPSGGTSGSRFVKTTVPQHISKSSKSKIMSVTSGKAPYTNGTLTSGPRGAPQVVPMTIGGNQPKKDQSQIPNSPTKTKDMDNCESITEARIKEILSLWQIFPQAAIFASKGVPVITHQLPCPPLKINGLLLKSPLANNAFYSFESAEVVDDKKKRKYVNLYQIMIPDIPGKNGEISTAEFYSDRLHELGLRVHRDHFNWKGASIYSNDKLINVIHHYSDTHTPEEFSLLTIRALTETMELIEERATFYDVDAEDEDQSQSEEDES